MEIKHLQPWNDSLLLSIKEKQAKLEIISEIISEKEKISSSNEKELISLEKTMITILESVESHLENFSKNVQDKTTNVTGQKYDSVKEKGESYFNLYRDLYRDAKLFFSRQENKLVPSELEQPGIWNSENWVNVLTPIWFLEKQYSSIKTDHEKVKKLVNTYGDRCNEDKQNYKRLQDEINSIKKEMNALKEFSEKIKKVRDN